MKNTVTLGGAEQNVAPLKALQTAQFLDETPSTTLDRVKCSMRVIGQSLQNAGSLLVQGVTDEDLPAKINDLALSLKEVDNAFAAVIEISGLRVAKPEEKTGEAPAAESTSNESSAAS